MSMENLDLDKVNDLIGLKQFDEAKAILKEIVKLDTKNVEAFKLLGLCNVNLGCFKEGQSNFETVVKYNSEDATSWFYLGNCYDNLEDFRHAKAAYLEVIKLRENYLDAYKSLGIIYIKTQETLKAFELAKKALEFEENDYLLYYMAGTALLAEKRFEQCIEYLEKAKALNPTHSQIYNNLGTAYLTLGNYALAYETYIKASEINPRNSITFYNIASILQIQSKHKEACEFFEKAYNIEGLEHYLVSLALSEFKSEQYELAVEHYKKLIVLHPEKNNFRYNLACCYEKMGEYIFAIGILEQLVLLNPKAKAMLQKLANLYLITDAPNKAKEVYEKLLNQGLVSEDIYYEYALICVKTGDTFKAETILKKVIELNPKAAYARKDLGVIFLEKRLFDDAKKEFQSAYELEPEDESVIFEYANFMYATSDFVQAEELYNKALEINPNNPNTLIFSALNSYALTKYEEALDFIERALKIVPQDAFVLLTAGKINYALENFDKALMYLIHSWEIDKNVDVENLLGLTYLELEEYEKANNIFTKLLEKSPMNTNLLLNSAKCYEKMNDLDSAKNQLKNALQIFPEMEAAQDMLDSIEKAS